MEKVSNMIVLPNTCPCAFMKWGVSLYCTCTCACIYLILHLFIVSRLGALGVLARVSCLALWHWHCPTSVDSVE